MPYLQNLLALMILFTSEARRNSCDDIRSCIYEFDLSGNFIRNLVPEKTFRHPESLKVYNNCYVENYAAEKKPGEYLQFQRIGYFMADLDTTSEHPVFNKTVGLKDTWAKQNKK